MKANGLRGWVVAAGLGMALAAEAMGQAATARVEAKAATAAVESAQTTTAPVEVKRTIVVSLEDRKLALIEDGKVEKVYAVAVGKATTPSPTGTFTIQRRVKNPVYHHDGKTVEPGPMNPVGSRWMGLNIKGYGIHGTNAPKSIGKAASHGCIRMGKADVEELFERVHVGDTVELIGQRNEETAQLFGEQKPAVTEQPVVTASATTSPVTTESATESVAVTGNN